MQWRGIALWQWLKDRVTSRNLPRLFCAASDDGTVYDATVWRHTGGLTVGGLVITKLINVLPCIRSGGITLKMGFKYKISQSVFVNLSYVHYTMMALCRWVGDTWHTGVHDTEFVKQVAKPCDSSHAAPHPLTSLEKVTLGQYIAVFTERLVNYE